VKAEVINNSGHFISIDQSEDVDRKIIAFLSSN